jgi:hypothetical protein
MGQEMPDLGRTGLDGGTLASRMGIKIMELSAERVTGTMPVAGNTQPYGLLHGGASCVLAETLGSLGAMTHAGPGPRRRRHRDQRDAPPDRQRGRRDRRCHPRPWRPDACEL